MSIKYANNNSLSAIDTQPSGLSGSNIALISTTTASSSANVAITSGIDSTYKEYQIHGINIHGQTDDRNLRFITSTDSGSSYGVATTSTAFRALHCEDGSEGNLSYSASFDLAQGTGAQLMNLMDASGADSCMNFILTLYDWSNTTFVKHWTCRSCSVEGGADGEIDMFTAGYVNTTSAVNAIKFDMNSGNIDAGTFKLYGVS